MEEITNYLKLQRVYRLQCDAIIFKMNNQTNILMYSLDRLSRLENKIKEDNIMLSDYFYI